MSFPLQLLISLSRQMAASVPRAPALTALKSPDSSVHPEIVPRLEPTDSFLEVEVVSDPYDHRTDFTPPPQIVSVIDDGEMDAGPYGLSVWD